MTKNEKECLIFVARQFATKAHLGQRRKYTGEPYIVHPIAVAELVRQRGGTPEMIMAALLHDTVEDTNVKLSDIYANFGAKVTGLVAELTDVYTKEDYPEMNRKERKGLEARRMANISPEAKLIKVCDLADNTKTIVEHDPGFATVYLREKAYLLEQMGYTADADELL